MSDTKQCEQCGNAFSRGRTKRWDFVRQRFCSLSCSSKQRRKSAKAKRDAQLTEEAARGTRHASESPEFIGPVGPLKRTTHNRTREDVHDWFHFFGDAWIGPQQWCRVFYKHEPYHVRSSGARAWSRLLLCLRQCGVGFEQRRGHNLDADSMEQCAAWITQIRLGDLAREWLASAVLMADGEPDPQESDEVVWGLFRCAELKRLARAS